MKVFLPIRLATTGGTSTFAHNLQQSFAERGHVVTFSFSHQYDALLIPAVCPLRYLLHAKLFRRPIIHRLDGVYYPATVAGRWWRLHNFPMRVIRRWFATATIYQSQYSKQCANKFLGTVSHPTTVIYNGVDVTHFTPNGPRKKLHLSPGEKIVITWSRFRRADQLKPAILAVEHCRNYFSDNIRFIVIGNFDPPLPANPAVLLQQWGYDEIPDWLDFQGPVSNKLLPAYARAADVFLFTHLNPPCPNNVLEALACGLPICGIADGAMPELVQASIQGKLLATDDGAFFRERALDIGHLAEQLHTLLKHQTVIKNTTQPSLLSDYFSLTHMTNQYDRFLSRQDINRHPAG